MGSQTSLISLKITGWISFFAELLIIATGGAVRLTDSGLGCPSWPSCTPESLVPTGELSYHSLIEFGNRTMTVLLGFTALAVIIATWRVRKNRRDLWVLALIVLSGVVLQALLGGVTVLTGLNPFIVGFHYLASVSLVSVAAVYLARLYPPQLSLLNPAPNWFYRLSLLTGAVLLVTIMFGMFATGAGPYSGDPQAGRNGFNAELLQHVHAWPGYALGALTVVLLIFAVKGRLLSTRTMIALLAVELAQITVGIYQSRSGLPPFAVGVHMVFAGIIAAVYAVLLERLSHRKSPVKLDATNF